MTSYIVDKIGIGNGTAITIFITTASASAINITITIATAIASTLAPTIKLLRTFKCHFHGINGLGKGKKRPTISFFCVFNFFSHCKSFSVKKLFAKSSEVFYQKSKEKTPVSHRRVDISPMGEGIRHTC